MSMLTMQQPTVGVGRIRPINEVSCLAHHPKLGEAAPYSQPLSLPEILLANTD